MYLVDASPKMFATTCSMVKVPVIFVYIFFLLNNVLYEECRLWGWFFYNIPPLIWSIKGRNFKMHVFVVYHTA